MSSSFLTKSPSTGPCLIITRLRRCTLPQLLQQQPIEIDNRHPLLYPCLSFLLLDLFHLHDHFPDPWNLFLDLLMVTRDPCLLHCLDVSKLACVRRREHQRDRRLLARKRHLHLLTPTSTSCSDNCMSYTMGSPSKTANLKGRNFTSSTTKDLRKIRTRSRSSTSTSTMCCDSLKSRGASAATIVMIRLLINLLGQLIITLLYN